MDVAVVANDLAITLVVCWSLTVVLCVVVLTRHLCLGRGGGGGGGEGGKRAGKVLTLLFCLVLIPCLCRLVNDAVWMGQSISLDWQQQSFAQVLLGSSAGYFDFVSLSLLAFAFAVLYHGVVAARAGRGDDMRGALFKWFVGVNVFAILGWVVLMIVLSMLQEHSGAFVLAHKVEAGYAITMAMGASVVFTVYGLLLYCSYGSSMVIAARVLSRRIVGVCIVCGVTLFVRSVLLFLLSYHTWSPLQNVLLQFVEQMCFEMIPTVVIVLAATSLASWKPTSPETMPIIAVNN